MLQWSTHEDILLFLNVGFASCFQLGKKNRIVLVFFHILGLAAGAHRPFANPLKPFTTFLAAIVLSLQPLRRNIDIDRPTNGTHPGIHLTRCIIRQDDNPIGQG
jgi:hypothetical protein